MVVAVVAAEDLVDPVVAEVETDDSVEPVFAWFGFDPSEVRGFTEEPFCDVDPASDEMPESVLFALSELL